MIERIHLDRDRDQPLYVQLYQQLKGMIEKGILKENEKLLPIRRLAKRLEINNVTVVNAYKLLEEEEMVNKKVGSGTYVAPIRREIEQDIFVDEEIQLMNQGQMMMKQNAISFATSTPDAELFPINDVKRAINHVLDRDGGKAFGYQESLGYKPLREVFSRYLLKKKITCQSLNIQVVSGAQQGIDILAKSLLNYGDVVFTEEPTYTGAISAFKSRGAKVVTIPIREDGIDLKILEARLAEYQPKFLYLMTNFQNPTGYSYSEKKKKRLLEIAREWGVIIVEDDCLNELYFGQEPARSLRAMDGADRVIYIKSFSKIFLPGFRIAFMVIPDEFVGRVMAAKHSSDISSSGLIQRTFDHLLREGLWEKHLAGMRQLYQDKYNHFIELMDKLLPEQVDYNIPMGGLNFWLSLPDGYSSNRLYKKCLSKGVIFVPGSVFYPDGEPSPYFRLSIAAVEEEEMARGIRILSKVIREFLNEENSDEFIGFTPLM